VHPDAGISSRSQENPRSLQRTVPRNDHSLEYFFARVSCCDLQISLCSLSPVITYHSVFSATDNGNSFHQVSHVVSLMRTPETPLWTPRAHCFRQRPPVFTDHGLQHRLYLHLFGVRHWCLLWCSMIETRTSRRVDWLVMNGKKLGRYNRRPLDIHALVSFLVFHTFYIGLSVFLQTILIPSDSKGLEEEFWTPSSVRNWRRKVLKIWSESDQYQVSYDFLRSVSFVSSRGTWR
jgi:hypothetical protein